MAKTFTQPARDPPNILHEAPEPLQPQTTPFYDHNPAESNHEDEGSHRTEGKFWNPRQGDYLADDAE